MAEDYDLPEQLLTEALVRDLNAGKVRGGATAGSCSAQCCCYCFCC